MKTKLSKERVKLPEHLHEFEGDLYDNRKIGFDNQRIRTRYSWHYGRIRTAAELKATLRGGSCAWPGGYPLYFITSDGEALSFEAVFQEYRQVVDSVRNKITDGWRVIACEINYEDQDLYCAHTGDLIEPACGKETEEEREKRMAKEDA